LPAESKEHELTEKKIETRIRQPEETHKRGIGTDIAASVAGGLAGGVASAVAAQVLGTIKAAGSKPEKPKKP
jgi:hypothetical protein